MTAQSPGSSGAGRSAKGVLLMILAMLIIPLVDGIAKYLSRSYSPLFISWGRYAVACGVVIPIAAAWRGKRLFPAERLGAHILRTLFLVIAMTLYFLALARIPLASAVSAYFVGPVVSVLLSIAILKERLTLKKALSVMLGFFGALVILKPGGALALGTLMAFGAGFFFALYMIATRQASKESDPVSTLVFQC